MYRMAAYCRLSKDDGENKISESIENQLKLIREYVEKSEDMKLEDIYIDDGYSGLYFTNRPEFQRMMEDIYKGRIQGVISKDISRLGREHIETSNYMERVFPTLGIRYIAILDGVDSLSNKNEELAQFKTLLNDMYSRDISKKIRGSLLTQKKSGQFVSGFAPYGYIKNPEDKHHFLIDEEAAEIVQRIFSLYLQGHSVDGIAKQLNEEGVLTPSEYKRQVQGLRYVNAREMPGAKAWTYPTIHAILRNRVYTGAMVQHKSEKISYKIDKCRYIPQEEQYIVEGMHEPIITNETFQLVQSVRKKRARTSGFRCEKKGGNPYAGILVCGDCGSHLQRVTGRNGYECSSYHKKGNQLCCSHFIRKEILDSVVKQEIKRQAALALGEREKEDIRKAADWSGKAERGRKKAERQIVQLQKKLFSIQRYQKKTYESYLDGLLNKEEYVSYQEAYKKEAVFVSNKLAQLQTKSNRLAKGAGETGRWLEVLIEKGVLKEATRELVIGLIEKVKVNGDKSIEIEWKYQSPYLQNKSFPF